MNRRPPISTRPDTLFPNTTRFRSVSPANPSIHRTSVLSPDADGAAFATSGAQKRPPTVLDREPLLLFAEYRTPNGPVAECRGPPNVAGHRSEEHTSELQSLMRISYAVFCLKNKNQTTPQI